VLPSPSLLFLGVIGQVIGGVVYFVSPATFDCMCAYIIRVVFPGLVLHFSRLGYSVTRYIGEIRF
jgi:hypothetical protein